MEELNDEYIVEKGLYFLGSFFSCEAYRLDWGINYSGLMNYNFDEKSFASLLYTLTKVVTERKVDTDEIKKLFKLLVDKLIFLDWNDVWLNINIEDYCDFNEQIFMFIMKVVNIESFVNKVGEYDNVALAYEFYMLYGKLHNISKKEIEEKFILYLDAYIKRTGSTYKELFSYYFEERDWLQRPSKHLANLLSDKLNMGDETKKTQVLKKY